MLLTPFKEDAGGRGWTCSYEFCTAPIGEADMMDAYLDSFDFLAGFSLSFIDSL